MLEPHPGKDLQLVAPFSMVPEVLRRLAVNPTDVLQAAGLPADALNDPQNTIPYHAVGLLLQEAADRTKCAHFGLEIGKQFRTSYLGLVGQLMRNAITVGVSMRDFVGNQHRNAHGSVAYLLEDHQRVFWGYASYHAPLRGYHILCDFAAMAGLNLLCELVGTEHTRVVEVLLSRAEPENRWPYYHAFGTKVRFDAEQTALVVPKTFLELAVTGAEPAQRAGLERQIAALWHAGELDTVTHLRRILRVALFNGPVSGDDIAARLGMSRRTLHRRLAVHQLRFKDVLDETRCEFAQQLLAITRLRIGEIATIVGYADPAVLTHSFFRWAGVSPTQWRSRF